MEYGNERMALITNIQRFTVHDGPGIRTEVFFKGCPLRCLWCSNPEGISPIPEVGVFSRECIGLNVCGLCIKACPQEGALLADGNRIIAIDFERCKKCLKCANACPNNALRIYGIEMTVSDLLKEIVKDRSFYQKTGGGVTLSGGDCLLQADFVLDLLRACKRAGIHTCVESELFCPTQVLDSILPYTDLVMTDIKHMDQAKHREYTGVSNREILANIKYLAIKCVPLVVRIPVVPGYNDDENNIKASAEFLGQYVGGSLRQLQLLPYRPLGLEKYTALGKEYPMKDFEIPAPSVYLDKVRLLAEEFQSYGIPATAGTTLKFK